MWLIYISFQYLAMSCGVIRGALANIGVNSVVTAEVSAMPSCKLLPKFHSERYYPHT